MRPARRVIARQGRRILPEQSRLVAWGAGELCSRPAGLRTIAGGFGNPPRVPRLTIPRTVAALRRSRKLRTDIEAQLDGLLVSLRQPQPCIDVAAPERLTGATAQAGRALAALDNLRCLW